jgi:hypothetical protein
MRTTPAFLVLLSLPLCALAGIGPTLSEHEAMEALIADIPEAAIEGIEHRGDMITVKVLYDDDFRQAIAFSERIMTIFELSFVDEDWTILTLDPDRAVVLRRQFRGKSRPCGHVRIDCREKCLVGVNFPFRCDMYPVD